MALTHTQSVRRAGTGARAGHGVGGRRRRRREWTKPRIPARVNTVHLSDLTTATVITSRRVGHPKGRKADSSSSARGGLLGMTAGEASVGKGVHQPAEAESNDHKCQERP